MGNTGFRKLFMQNNMVETKYRSLYEMNVETIDKEEVTLQNLQGQYSLIVNCGSEHNESDKHFQELKNMLETKNINLLLFPSNSFLNEKQNFKKIKEIYEAKLGTSKKKKNKVKIFTKVEVNGKYTHYVYRFLKRNIPELYNKDICEGNQIQEDFSKILVNPEGLPVKYFKRNEKIEIQ